MRLPRTAIIEKKVGETPLQAMEAWRTKTGIEKSVPLAYAGRLDPMASGKLLILIGEECKKQKEYHGLDKEYDVSLLLGFSSDSGDVLGLARPCEVPKPPALAALQNTMAQFTGAITLPYPAFSSKTVASKPLHTWSVEGRLAEIEIPTYTSHIYSIRTNTIETISASSLYTAISEKIETIPPVTDERKALGNDFRRPDIRTQWKQLFEDIDPSKQFYVVRFSCVCASGLYMRSLAEEIAKASGTCGLAYAIHRRHIGKYQPLFGGFGIWKKRYG